MICLPRQLVPHVPLDQLELIEVQVALQLEQQRLLAERFELDRLLDRAARGSTRR